MDESRLDREFPQGDPQSPTCRHCNADRIVIAGGGIVCRTCDGGAISQRRGDTAAT